MDMPPDPTQGVLAILMTVYPDCSSEGSLVMVPDEFKCPEKAICLRLRYFAEGNANIIFEIESKPGAHDDSQALGIILKNRLLRIPKLSCGHTSAQDDDAVKEFRSCDLVNQGVVLLDSHILHRLNSYLAWPSIRTMRAGRTGKLYVPLDGSPLVSGILVVDMRLNPDKDQVTIHFKPKWLTQSPSAPVNAKRCRTCALQASKGSKRTTHHCPLALATGKLQLVRKEISAIIDAKAGSESDLVRLYKEHLARYFSRGIGREVIKRLQHLQEKNDPGLFMYILDRENASYTVQYGRIRTLAQAMTFRDCTIYVRITPPLETDGLQEFEDFRYEMRLGDLDKKVPDEVMGIPSDDNIKLTIKKARKWGAQEQELHDGGYYMGMEELEDGEQRHESCLLWTDHRTRRDLYRRSGT